MLEFEQWRCGELTLQDAAAPHTVDCGIWADFTAPSGRVIRREAFWDGGDTFRLRFAPTEPGVWRYTVEGLQEGAREGALTCVPYAGELPLYRHGFLRVGPRGRYLCHADGAPFFWLGDTHWHFAVAERWDESNDPRFDSQFRAIVDRRAAQKFSVYQCNFHCEAGEDGDPETARYFTKTGQGWAPRLEFLQRDLDLKMDYLAQKGFAIAVGFSWFFSAFAPGAEGYYKMAARYLIARYGAYPVIWTLAGEVGAYSPDMRQLSIDFWRAIALEVERLDSYHHLQTAHYTNERPFPEYYQGERWFDFTLNQAGHGDYIIDGQPYATHRAAHPAKPFVEAEAMYEQVLTLEANGRRQATPALVRRAAYLAMQCGACGYTYGAQGMWHLQWDEPRPDEPSLGFGSFPPWYKAIDFPGADHMTIFRDFYESVGWHRLSPLPPACLAARANGIDVGQLGEGGLFAKYAPYVLADEEMSTVVAYYTDTNRTAAAGFKTLSRSCYTAQWFDPATGRYTLISSDVRPVEGVWFPPEKPCVDDLLLVLRANG